MHVHQLSSFWCWSVCFLDFPWKLFLLDDFLCQHEWHLNYEKGCLPTILVWKSKWCNPFLVSTNECSSTFIFSVLISLFPWFSMKVLVTWWFLCQHEWHLNYEKDCIHTILVWRIYWCNLFLMSTNACSSTLMFSVLFSLFPDFSCKLKLLDNYSCHHEWH